MPRDLVIWTGPVAEFQVPDATIEGAERHFVGCRGDLGDHPHCPTIGQQLKGSPSSLYNRFKVPEEEVGDLILGAFSAGGSILKNLWVNPDYRAATTAAYLSDAIWTAAWADPSSRVPPPDEGFVAYAVDVANGPGDKLLIATTSPHPNREFATGHENLDSVKAEIERRTGRKFMRRSSMPGGIEPPASAEVWQLGNVIFAKYPEEPLGHGHTKIAGDVFGGIIQPWLAKGKGPIDSPGGLPPIPSPPGTTIPPVPPMDWSPVARQAAIVTASMIAGFSLTQLWRNRR